MRIQKRQLFINDKEFRTEVEYDEEALNVAFLVYVYDVISLLLYACAAVSFIFICSGKIIIPLIMCIYISILLIIIVLTVIKLAFEKKKKQLIHTLILQM